MLFRFKEGIEKYNDGIVLQRENSLQRFLGERTMDEFMTVKTWIQRYRELVEDYIHVTFCRRVISKQ